MEYQSVEESIIAINKYLFFINVGAFILVFFLDPSDIAIKALFALNAVMTGSAWSMEKNKDRIHSKRKHMGV